jgi:subtilase family serine protease
MGRALRKREIWRAVKAVKFSEGSTANKSNIASVEVLEPRMMLNGMTLDPKQIAIAYGLNKIQKLGAGETIAIIMDGNNSNVVQQVHEFNALYSTPTYKLPQFSPQGPTFTIEDEHGTPLGNPKFSAPLGNASSDDEEAGDVEYAHVVAPYANIILVETNSLNSRDVRTAINTAKNTSGVTVVSMSFNGPSSNYNF